MGGLEILAIISFGCIAVYALIWKEKKLSDPSDKTAIYLEQLPQVSRLANGKVHVLLIRQSGNVYKDLGVFHTSGDAIEAVMKSFRRAKIDSIYILENELDRLNVQRLHHNHRGRAEGKVLGGARLGLVR